MTGQIFALHAVSCTGATRYDPRVPGVVLRFGMQIRRVALLGAVSLSACLFGINPDYDDVLESVLSESGNQGSETGATEAGEPMPGSLELPATFSACRGTGDYGPAQCSAGATMPDALVIDLESDDLGLDLVACLIFTLDDTFAGQSVTQATLEVYTTGGVEAASIASGEVWAVEPFTTAEFELELPAKLGVEPLAPDPGAALIHQPIQWELPTEIAIPNTQLYLCVYPLSDDDVQFFSREGQRSPVLLIEYE